jgi:3-oxoacyl-[acyl-carrier protein] reductase
MIDTGLQGKAAIVTGSNHGLGAASARALAAQGCAVLLNYQRLPERDRRHDRRLPNQSLVAG